MKTFACVSYPNVSLAYRTYRRARATSHLATAGRLRGKWSIPPGPFLCYSAHADLPG